MSTKRRVRRARGRQREQQISNLRADRMRLLGELQKARMLAARLSPTGAAEAMLERIFGDRFKYTRDCFLEAVAREAGFNLGEAFGAELNRHFLENDAVYRAKIAQAKKARDVAVSSIKIEARLENYERQVAEIRFSLPSLQFCYRF